MVIFDAHDIVRSYLDAEFPEGPENGIFPRGPDLREFVVAALDAYQ